MFKFVFACSLLLLAGSAAAVNYDVYIIAGQSNADGRARAGDLDSGDPLAGLQAGTIINYANPAEPDSTTEISFDTGFQTLQPGFSVPPRRADTLAVPSTDYFGPELSFAASIGQASGSTNPVAIVKVTRGGTNLRSDWRADDNLEDAGFLYSTLIEQVTSSLVELNQDGDSATLRGFVWHQGEADRNRSDYLANITDFIDGVRDHFGEDLPFVLGELSRDRDDNTNFNNNLASLVADPTSTDLGLVSSVGLSTTDLTHFDTASQVLLGERYADALAALLADPILGDYNGDGFVSQADLDLVLLNWGESVVPAEWVATDQFDGVQVSQNELDGVLLNWGSGVSPITVIPEPASAIFLGLMAAHLLPRRGHRCYDSLYAR